MFYKSEKMEWKTSTRKYVKICIFICTAYVIYTVFTNFLCDFVILEWGMKIRAIETAFTFLYFISVIYLSVVLLERNNCVRTVIYLISTVVVTAPFIVVEPVTPRCFFIEYIFWILAAGEIFFSAYRSCELLRSSCVKNVISVTACILALFICNIDITNKYYNNIRIDYIKEQLENNSEQVYIIKLPYSSYCYDDLDDYELFNRTFFAGFSPAELTLKYYGIEVEKDNFNYLLIDVLDYNVLTE